MTNEQCCIVQYYIAMEFALHCITFHSDKLLIGLKTGSSAINLEVACYRDLSLGMMRWFLQLSMHLYVSKYMFIAWNEAMWDTKSHANWNRSTCRLLVVLGDKSSLSSMLLETTSTGHGQSVVLGKCGALMFAHWTPLLQHSLSLVLGSHLMMDTRIATTELFAHVCGINWHIRRQLIVIGWFHLLAFQACAKRTIQELNLIIVIYSVTHALEMDMFSYSSSLCQFKSNGSIFGGGAAWPVSFILQDFNRRKHCCDVWDFDWCPGFHFGGIKGLRYQELVVAHWLHLMADGICLMDNSWHQSRCCCMWFVIMYGSSPSM